MMSTPDTRRIIHEIAFEIKWLRELNRCMICGRLLSSVEKMTQLPAYFPVKGNPSLLWREKRQLGESCSRHDENRELAFVRDHGGQSLYSALFRHPDFDGHAGFQEPCRVIDPYLYPESLNVLPAAYHVPLGRKFGIAPDLRYPALEFFAW